MTDPTPSKLAEARKLIENRNSDLVDLLMKRGGYPIIEVALQIGSYIDRIKEAQALISYERGREEQREQMAKDISPMCGIPDASDACRAILKYLNPSSNAK